MITVGSIIRAATGEAPDIIQLIIDRIGMTSIASTVGLVTAQKSDAIPETTMIISDWLMTDYALLISTITCILVGMEKALNMYFKVKAERKESKNTPDKVG